MRKTGIRLGILCAAVLLLLAAGLFAAYPLAADPAAWQQQIQRRVAAAENGTSPAVTLYDSVALPDRTCCLIQVGDRLGSATLTRGLLGGYRLAHLGYGDGSLLDGIVESGGQSWLILGGRDTACRIASVTVEIEGRVYTLEKEPDADRFLLYTVLAGHPSDNHIDRERLHFYDAAGRDITVDYDLSGGGIQ